MIVLVLVFLALIIFTVWVLCKLKDLNYGNLTLVTGGVKVGKTMFSVYLVKRTYKKQLRKWKRACRKAKRSYQAFPEKPLIYSNMPLNVKWGYVPITEALVLQKERFRYGSVIYFNEITFIAGSKDIKDDEINDILLRFYKLIAHETRGGYCIVDTQAIQDAHFALKRSLSTYYMLIKKIWLPFFNIVFLRENIFVDGENTVAIDTQVDPQDSPLMGGKKLYVRLLPHTLWKNYDQYAYSYFTDALPCRDDLRKPSKEDLKVKHLIRLKTIIERRKQK